MGLTQKLQPDAIETAVQFLREGKVIAFPTETVYGLGAPIFNLKAIADIFALKGRPADNPLIAHVCDFAQLESIIIDPPSFFFALATAFFPGPLTLIVKRHPDVPSIVSGGLDSIAVRMPKDPIARNLITALGEPIVAPSANLSGKPSATCCKHVLEDFDGKIAAVIDGGPTPLGIESTVLSLLQDPPLLLRPGTVSKGTLEKFLGTTLAEADPRSPQAILSPGMKYRHYSPRTSIQVFSSLQPLYKAIQEHPKPLVLTRFPSFPLLRGDHFPLSASQLYAMFRRADAEGHSGILILCDEIVSQDAALKNRLMRACGL